MQLKIEMSEIYSYVSDAPLTTQNIYEIDVELQPGKPYLIGELNNFKIQHKQANIFNLTDDRGKIVLQVWAQLYRLGSGSVSEEIKKLALCGLNEFCWFRFGENAVSIFFRIGPSEAF